MNNAVDIVKTVGSPYIYFGGKSKVAHIIWERLGDVSVYIEPFFGSGAVMLLRPHQPTFEIANDIDAFVANLWRAVQHDTEGVVDHCDRYVHEVDLHALHRWMHGRKDFIEKMKSDPDWYDVEVAGVWLWGAGSWIADDWFREKKCNSIPNITGYNGIHKREIRGQDNVQPFGGERKNILAFLNILHQRMRHVKFCCGDWSRVVTGGALGKQDASVVGIFADPPYSAKDRDDIYLHEDFDVAAKVREWCLAEGDNPARRICLAGYDGDYDMPKSWDVVYWTAAGGYGNQNKQRDNVNRRKERLYFSPHCHKVGLFD